MPFTHHACICRDDKDLIDAGNAWISEGLDHGGVVLIATAPHLHAFEAAVPGINAARRVGRYVHYDADDLLAHFMVGDLPDPNRFRDCLESMLSFVETPRVRVFGEMAGLLRARDQLRASHLVEQLWNELGPTWGGSRELTVMHPYQLSTFSDVDSIADVTAHHAACG